MSEIQVVTIAEQGPPGPIGPAGPAGTSGEVRGLNVESFQSIRGCHVWLTADYHLADLTDTLFDTLTLDGINFIWLAVFIVSETQTGTILLPQITTNTLQAACDLCRSKGFMTGFKPHVTWNDSNAQYKPADVQEFADNYQAIFLQYLAAGTWDMIDVANELESVTNLNLPGWTSLIEEVRLASPSVPITASCTIVEVTGSCLFLDQLDVIGWNFYPKLILKPEYTVDDIISCLFRSNWDDLHLEIINELHYKYSKPILITEVGVLPYDNFPASIANLDDTMTYNPEAQAKYYQAIFETIGKMENVHGMCWWEVSYPSGPGSFSFIGLPAEAIVRENWGAV